MGARMRQCACYRVKDMTMELLPFTSLSRFVAEQELVMNLAKDIDDFMPGSQQSNTDCIRHADPPWSCSWLVTGRAHCGAQLENGMGVLGGTLEMHMCPHGCQTLTSAGNPPAADWSSALSLLAA
mmetsp:Transcript_111543/g.310623  ORF Transcript_111543/g.310623 Transcript_111543/m.310623 type:complete len:125 (-) Transcript_111543:100-474(-)